MNWVCRPSVCPSVRPSFRLSGRSREIVLLVFSKFWHDARNPYEVVHDRAEFSRKKIFLSENGIMGKNGPKTEFF